MSDITEQVHKKFKIFTGPLQGDGSLGALADEVTRFVREAGIAPKSIGVEFIDTAKRLVLTLGYRDDEPGYPVNIQCVPVGRVEQLDAAGLTHLEQALGRASAGVPNIICHELYITQDHDFFMVFMTAAK
jgi:hypothetical protein